jgi:hypothetical protein
VSHPIRQQIEDAIIELLHSRLGKGNPQSGYLQHVGPYNGEITDAEGPDDFRRILTGRSPGCLVTAGSATLTSQSTQLTRIIRLVTIEIYAISNQMRTRENRLRRDVVAEGDAGADPGIYKIAEDVQQCLTGTDLGLDRVGRILPAVEDVLLQLPDLTVWRLQYRVKTQAHVEKLDAGDRAVTGWNIDGNLIDTDGETQLPSPPNPFAEADTDL